MIPKQTVKYNQRIFDVVGKHMPFRMILVLVSIILNQPRQYLQIVKAYAITKPSIAFLPQQYIRLVDQTNQQQLQQPQLQHQSSLTKKVKYDLGIQQSNEINLNIDEVTQYLVEHESVNDFPSPILLAQHEPTKSNEYPEKSIPVAETTVTTTATATNTKKRKQHPPLIPNRLTDDSVLKIVQNRHHHHHHRPQQHHQSLSSSSSPHTITQAIVHPQMINGHDFDINTAWIELLIHEQQMKLMTSTTTTTAAAVTA